MTDTLIAPLTDLELEILESLDFEPSCEHSNHERGHEPGQAARFFVRALTCPECGTPGRDYLLCESGWVKFGVCGARCADCNKLQPRSQLLMILQDLKERK